MEKNILAYFKAPEQAEGVSRKLQALRAIDVSVDRVEKYQGDGVDHIENPITGDFSGLGALTQGADFGGRSAGILAAADVDASGLSDGGGNSPTGYNWLLTVVVDEADFDKAMQVVEEAGGKV